VEKKPTKHSPDGAVYEPLTKQAAEHAVTKSYKKLTTYHKAVNPKTKQQLLRLPVSVRQYHKVVLE